MCVIATSSQTKQSKIVRNVPSARDVQYGISIEGTVNAICLSQKSSLERFRRMFPLRRGFQREITEGKSGLRLLSLKTRLYL
jgi:hypothetical protein